MDSYERRTWWSRYDLTARLTDDAFLEGVVCAGFAIAAADGRASEVEQDALIDRLEILGGIDRDRIDTFLTAAAHLMEADASNFDAIVARCAELLQDKNAGEAAMMVALTIADAEDDVSAEEREIASQLATAIGLPGLDLDAMLIELRNQ